MAYARKLQQIYTKKSFTTKKHSLTKKNWVEYNYAIYNFRVFFLHGSLQTTFTILINQKLIKKTTFFVVFVVMSGSSSSLFVCLFTLTDQLIFY